MKEHIYLFLLIILTSCTSSAYLPDKEKDFYAPPGTVFIQNNLYMDQTEVTNIAWREYLYWLKQNSDNSEEDIQKASPDTSVFKNQNNKLLEIEGSYFTNPKYNNFPIVGVTYEQAVAYTKWRNERVLEVILLNDILLEIDSLDKMGSEKLKELSEKVDFKNYYVPFYSLPKREDYKIPKNKESYKDSEGERDLLKSPHGETDCSVFCSKVHGLNSNAFEYLKDRGVIHSGDLIIQSVNGNAQTSFRNVATWLPIDEYLATIN